MTYGQFLIIFLILPIGLMLGMVRRHLQRTHLVVLGSLSLVALVYTTPWDNYLVAKSVWWYSPKLVTGITLGWVPLEEYLFFILQPMLAGLWTFYMDHRLTTSYIQGIDRPRLRWFATLTAGSIWLVAVGTLLAGWKPGTYLGLELAWFLPPIILQLSFGADILWRQRRGIALALVSLILYFCATDVIAIGAGTWAINPTFSVGELGSLLPVEEFIFFLLTNTLIVWTVTLLRAPESQIRGQHKCHSVCCGRIQSGCRNDRLPLWDWVSERRRQIHARPANK